jgi:DNA-binding transcriptional ArsR family regulator
MRGPAAFTSGLTGGGSAPNQTRLRISASSNILRNVQNVRRLKAEIFQALGHPTRLAILETLQDGELTVNALLSRLGMEQANLSQHLAILRTRRLVANRKEGNRVFYSLRDPILRDVLALMRRYAASHLAEDVALLKEMEERTDSA